MTSQTLFALLALTILPTSTRGQWSMQESGTKARFRGLCVVGADVVWVGGTSGTYARTTDGGKTWKSGQVPGASELDFRDVQAFDDQKAYLLAAGDGDHSRLYKTTDGGATWDLLLTNPDEAGFFDAISFWDADRGLILGDPVDGRFVILTTGDGGRTWRRTRPSGMPDALEREGAFAASGTSLAVHGRSHAWFGTGGGKTARVFRTTDGGRNWTAHATPIRAGMPTCGIFSLAFSDENHGVAVGGDYKRTGETKAIVAMTSDGGRTWTAPSEKGPGGYRSAVAFIPGDRDKTVVAVGPTGADLSIDGGASWQRLGDLGFHTVGFAGKPSAGWAAGENGTTARFVRPTSRQ